MKKEHETRKWIGWYVRVCVLKKGQKKSIG